MTLEELLQTERITQEEYDELKPKEPEPPKPQPKGESWFQDYINDLNGGDAHGN